YSGRWPVETLDQDRPHLRKIIEIAGVVHRLPGAQAALDARTPREARSQRDIDATEDFGLLPIVRRLRDHVVDLAVERRLDVIEAADLLAAEGQPTVCRRCDAVRIVTRRRRRLIISGEKATVPGAIVSHIEAHPLAQVVLDGDRALPVVALQVEAPQRIGRPERASR